MIDYNKRKRLMRRFDNRKHPDNLQSKRLLRYDLYDLIGLLSSPKRLANFCLRSIEYHENMIR